MKGYYVKKKKYSSSSKIKGVSFTNLKYFHHFNWLIHDFIAYDFLRGNYDSFEYSVIFWKLTFLRVLQQFKILKIIIYLFSNNIYNSNVYNLWVHNFYITSSIYKNYFCMLNNILILFYIFKILFYYKFIFKKYIFFILQNKFYIYVCVWKLNFIIYSTTYFYLISYQNMDDYIKKNIDKNFDMEYQ